MPQDPALQFAFEVRAQIGAPLDLGVTRAGHRRVIPVLGGTVQGSSPTGQPLEGIILPGGADWQILHPDGAADLEARYTLQTQDGALIQVTNRGMRRGDPDTLGRMNRGEPADVSRIYFRTVATFETSARAYLWLADALFIGTGERYPDRVHVRFHQVL
jgi:hypothetical protein